MLLSNIMEMNQQLMVAIIKNSAHFLIFKLNYNNLFIMIKIMQFIALKWNKIMKNFLSKLNEKKNYDLSFIFFYLLNYQYLINKF